MITVLPVKDINEIKFYFEKYNIEFTENAGVSVAAANDEVLGCCLYDIDNEKIIIRFITPENDIMLADGILRSALHIADFRGIENAFYSNSSQISIYKMLDFIKNEQEMSLKIEKLHESSCSCKKNNK